MNTAFPCLQKIIKEVDALFLELVNHKKIREQFEQVCNLLCTAYYCIDSPPA